MGRYVTKNTPSHLMGCSNSKTNTQYMYLLVRKLLYKWGVILYRTVYANNKAHVQYKIKDEWLENGFKLYKGILPKQFEQNIEKYKKDNTVEVTGIYKDLHESFLRVQFDKEKASKWLLKAYEERIPLRDKQGVYGRWIEQCMDERHYAFYQMAIDNWDDNQYFYVAKSGRVYSSVTNMPSAFRRFLHFDGQYLEEYDIKNAQPLLMSQMMDVDDLFAELTQSGGFYRYMQTELEFRGIDVGKNFKIDFFSKMLFGTHKRKSKIEQVFEELFPITHFSIRCMKHVKGYKSLSEMLQSEESNKMFNGVGQELIKKGVTDFVTVHDAILYKPSDSCTVVDTMEKCFYS